jgi:hypothetical protein
MAEIFLLATESSDGFHPADTDGPCRRWDDTRCDARRRLAHTLYGIPCLSSLVSTSCVGVPVIGVATLSVVLPASCLTGSRCSRTPYSTISVGEAPVRVATFCVGKPASCKSSWSSPSLEILYRRLDDKRCDARLLFVDVFYGISCLSSLNSTSCVGVLVVGVATPGVVLLVPCLIRSWCKRTPYTTSFAGVVAIGVATLDVDMPAAWRMSSWGSPSLQTKFYIGVGTISVAVLGVGVMSHGIPMLVTASFGISCPIEVHRRRDVRRQVSSIVSYGVGYFALIMLGCKRCFIFCYFWFGLGWVRLCHGPRQTELGYVTARVRLS